MAAYVNIIIDISNEKLDKTFQYKVPEALEGSLKPGMPVLVPFGKGNRQIKGYIVELTDQAEFDVSRMKEVLSAVETGISIEAHLIALAAWMRRNYGATMNQALKTVLPVKRKEKQREKRFVLLAADRIEAKSQLAEFERKHNTARARLLKELLQQEILPYEVVTGKLNITAGVIQALKELGLVTIRSERAYRNPLKEMADQGYHKTLNEEQQKAVEQVMEDFRQCIFKTYLLFGVTGSGKTEVYMELIAQVIKQGKQAIVLIPEIALTYQTVMRFYGRFGERISILNSRLSPGERFDQYERAKNGEIDIMIGPRSALFTPFLNLGLIIIDEEHETSYKSETLPRYHARETAIQRAKMAGASVVLGSATPSVDSYYKALRKEYVLLRLLQRVESRPLPLCHTVDLRQELREGNRSILSRKLQELMQQRLENGEQIMLFLNRRGVSGFVSCRACGHVMTCPHCDVSLSLHKTGNIICHYCGYEEPVPSVCPICGSSYISGFKAGTQKIEEVVRKRFPRAGILRMDADTTREKDSYEKILAAFSNHEADILIGTQMIVKGHDFKDVTLVGILAADLSLHVSSYRAGERTFQLLTQAAGRAGRGDKPGEVVIQTYSPEHYSIASAKAQDYEGFYQQEIAFRSLLNYPPVSHLLMVSVTSAKEEAADRWAKYLAGQIKLQKMERLSIIGPADAQIAKINDIYKKVIYLKHGDYQMLVNLKDFMEERGKSGQIEKQVSVSFDFNPL